MIIIMGSVGSGKTEQGTRLVKKLNCPLVSTSQLLRDHPSHKWHDHILKGILVDDQDIIDTLKPALEEVDAGSREFILDGAPRSIPQAKWLIGEIAAKRISLDAIINLTVSDHVVLERLKSRGREDDREVVIRKRLKDYHGITQPVLQYLESNGIKVNHINGENDPETVEKEIDRILGI